MSVPIHRTGLLTIDHRDTVGLPEATVRRMGWPKEAANGLFEAHTLTCGHCRTVVVLEPKRTRERAHCRKCNHYLCDRCGAAAVQNAECKPINKLIDELYEAALRQQKTEAPEAAST